MTRKRASGFQSAGEFFNIKRLKLNRFQGDGGCGFRETEKFIGCFLGFVNLVRAVFHAFFKHGFEGQFARPAQFFGLTDNFNDEFIGQGVEDIHQLVIDVHRGAGIRKRAVNVLLHDAQVTCQGA